MVSVSRTAGRIAWFLMAGAIFGCVEHRVYAQEAASPGSQLASEAGSGRASYAGGSEGESFRRRLRLQMDEYRRASAMLDAAYQRLSDRMDIAQRLALGQNQTIWLNAEQTACGSAGALNYECESKWSFARAAVLAAWQVEPRAIRVASKPRLPRPARPEAAVALKLPLPPPIPPEAAVLLALPLPPPVPPAGPAGPGRFAETYYVPVTAMPWVWKPGGENQAFSFGYPNGTAPVVVPLAALGVRPGRALMIEYAGGEIAIGKGGRPADARGYSGLNGQMGPLGAFPSRYIQGDPVNLGALVAVFTDRAGNILGAPFAVGAGRATRVVPPGASQLQLGINDDVFGGSTAEARNSGGFSVRIARSAG